jgi:hypothetical protein
MDIPTPAATPWMGRSGGHALHIDLMETHMLEESRNELHAQFARLFVDPSAKRSTVTSLELAQLARLLTTQLPASYVQFMRQYGPVSCHSILQLIAQRGLSYADLRQLLAPQDVLNKSRDLCCRQLPVGVFVFAVDSRRNAFCFRQSTSAQDDAPVLLFSVQQEKLVELRESFDGLLRRYVKDLCPKPVPVASS